MKISVVITAYNEEKYIVSCIESLLLQTYKNLEIVIVDNGSADDTFKVAKIFEKLRPNTIFVYRLEKNCNPAGGRNYGVTKSTGDILVFVDADMVFDFDYIENLIKPIKGKIIGTFHGTEKVRNLNKIWARTWSIDRQPNPPKTSHVFRAVLKEKFVNGGGFKEGTGCFDDDLGHIGESVIAKDAVCYHNNPETLLEAFKHCIWVGESLAMDKNYLTNILKRNLHLLVIMFIMLSLFVFLFFVYPIIEVAVFSVLLTIFVYIFTMILFAIGRVKDERYWKYIYSVPILNTVKNFGYAIGITKGVLWKK